MPNMEDSSLDQSRSTSEKVLQRISLESISLNRVENPWKPLRLRRASCDLTEEEIESEDLRRNMRGILNKLTPEKFEKLVEQFKKLPINSEQRLEEAVNLIYDKALAEPLYCKCYAQMCKMCSKLEVTSLVNDVHEKVNFRKLIITRCQNEFEMNKAEELDRRQKQIKISENTKEYQIMYEEVKRQIRMESVANSRLIGELFNLDMLTPAVIYKCIVHLLSNPDDEISLECLCQLFSTIGKKLEHTKYLNRIWGTLTLDSFFQQMAELSQKKESSNISSRIRFMLLDVIDLRANDWIPRREVNNPKTIQEINTEVQR